MRGWHLAHDRSQTITHRKTWGGNIMSLSGPTGCEDRRSPWHSGSGLDHLFSSHQTGLRYVWANGFSVVGACHTFAAIFGRLLPCCDAPEKLHPAGEDFGALALATVSAGNLERTSPQPALHVHLPSLLEVLVAVFRQLAEYHNPVPLNRGVPLLPLRVGIEFASCDREVHYRSSALQVPKLRIGTQVSDHHYSI